MNDRSFIVIFGSCESEAAWQSRPMTVKTHSANGCLFRYVHDKSEPDETLKMAVGVACTVAEFAAIDTGHSHVVARYIKRKGYVVFPADHRALQSGSVVPVYEITPASACIRLEQ
jgi:molybdopterin biosynthesis enzyme